MNDECLAMGFFGCPRTEFNRQPRHLITSDALYHETTRAHYIIWSHISSIINHQLGENLTWRMNELLVHRRNNNHTYISEEVVSLSSKNFEWWVLLYIFLYYTPLSCKPSLPTALLLLMYNAYIPSICTPEAQCVYQESSTPPSSLDAKHPYS